VALEASAAGFLVRKRRPCLRNWGPDRSRGWESRASNRLYPSPRRPTSLEQSGPCHRGIQAGGGAAAANANQLGRNACRVSSSRRALGFKSRSTTTWGPSRSALVSADRAFLQPGRQTGTPALSCSSERLRLIPGPHGKDARRAPASTLATESRSGPALRPLGQAPERVAPSASALRTNSPQRL